MKTATRSQDRRCKLERGRQERVWIVVALYMLLLPGTASADKHKGSNGVDGRTFNGVQPQFVLENRILCKPQSLKIRLVLTNASDRAVDFAYTAPVLHIRVYDAKKKLIEQRTDAPTLQPVVQTVHLTAHHAYETTLTVDLWTYYDLRPGDYYLRFYYDLRLLHDKTQVARYREMYHTSDLLLWDTRYYPFTVARCTSWPHDPGDYNLFRYYRNDLTDWRKLLALIEWRSIAGAV